MECQKYVLLRYGAHILVHDRRAHALFVWSWYNVFTWPPWAFHHVYVYHFRILDLRFDRKRQPQHFEAFNQWVIRRWNHLLQESTATEKFWTLSAFKWFPVMLCSYDAKLISNLLFLIRVSSKKGCQTQFCVKWSCGTKKRDSPVRVENRGVGTAEEIVALQLLASRKFPKFERLRIHL